MVVKDISFEKPVENILYDDVLLDLAERGQQGEALRFWESRETFVVLGRISNLWEDVHVDRARKDGIPVLRRSSGGGTVLQGKGCLNFTLVLSKDVHPQIIKLKESYQYILEKVSRSLENLGIQSCVRPISDLAVGENKFSGNAQKRGRAFILHHGTILYDFNLSLIEKYLKIPRSMPEYRRERPHADFVANLKHLKDFGRRWKKEMAGVFHATKKQGISDPEEKRLGEFVNTKEIVVDLKKL